MIEQIHGILVEKTPTFVVVDVNGVGYGVNISAYTAGKLPEEGAEVTLFTNLVVREDSMTLFGFAEKTEKNTFLMLLDVNGVGPKLALSVLSGLTVSELVAAIAESNVKRISSVHGVGKKTAERIIVELRDKVDPLEALAGRTAGGGDARNAMLRDAILALSQLGFPQDQARKMVQSALDADPAVTDTEVLLRKALSSK